MDKGRLVVTGWHHELRFRTGEKRVSGKSISALRLDAGDNGSLNMTRRIENAVRRLCKVQVLMKSGCVQSSAQARETAGLSCLPSLGKLARQERVVMALALVGKARHVSAQHLPGHRPVLEPWS